MSDYMTLLRAERDRGRSVSAIARDLGFARTSISLLLSGNYPADRAPRIEAKILEVLGRDVNCPHLGREIARSSCEEHRSRPMPTSSAPALKHWTACKTCPLNPAASAAPKKRT